MPRSHINISPPDSRYSQRFLCSCGTHYNSDPRNLKAAETWLNNHSSCGPETVNNQKDNAPEGS